MRKTYLMIACITILAGCILFWLCNGISINNTTEVNIHNFERVMNDKGIRGIVAPATVGCFLGEIIGFIAGKTRKIIRVAIGAKA